jgi:hypothetical protein
MAIRIQRASDPLPALPPRLGEDLGAKAPPNMGTLDQIKEMVPGISTGVYLAGIGVIPSEQVAALVGWVLFGLLVTIVVEAQQKHPQTLEPVKTSWNQVIVAAGAFIIWVYALGGGPFAAFKLYVPWLATLLILAYTTSSPWILVGLDKLFKLVKKPTEG